MFLMPNISLCMYRFPKIAKKKLWQACWRAGSRVRRTVVHRVLRMSCVHTATLVTPVATNFTIFRLQKIKMKISLLLMMHYVWAAALYNTYNVCLLLSLFSLKITMQECIFQNKMRMIARPKLKSGFACHCYCFYFAQNGHVPCVRDTHTHATWPINNNNGKTKTTKARPNEFNLIEWKEKKPCINMIYLWQVDTYTHMASRCQPEWSMARIWQK